MKKKLSGSKQIALGAVVLVLVNFLIMLTMTPLLQIILCILALIITWYGFRMIFQKGAENIYLSDMDFFSISKKSFRKLVFGLLIGTALFSAILFMLVIMKQYTIAFNKLNGVALIQGLALFIVVGSYEELFTRGVIQHLCEKRWNKWIALWGTSIIFSCLHLFNDSFTLFSFLGIIAAGVALGMTMYATNSISAAIGFHISWNWVQGYFYGISVSGTGLGTNVSVLKSEIIGTSDVLTGGQFGAEASIISSLILFLFSYICYLYGKKTIENR